MSNMSGTTATKPLVGTAGGSATTIAALLASLPSTAEKNKQIRRELLMERLRFHASQHKTFPELAKAMRMSMLEKRFALDSVEKSNLQKCLDSMQHCIQVSTREGLVERLENLSRQLGLKFVVDCNTMYISTDMFFVEISLKPDGTLFDIKVHHECKVEQQSCSELIECLNKGDFADFTVQLEGLTSIYQLNAEPKLKAKAFLALQAMEADLLTLSKISDSKGAQQTFAESSVGIVLPRRGGHPMKLTYFVPPQSLISAVSNSLEAITFEFLIQKDFGFSVSVHLEASSAKKLQILPTASLSQNPQNGNETIIYDQLTSANSLLLPATFVLKLNKPLPVCYNTWRKLTSDSRLEELDESSGDVNSLEEKKSPKITASVMKMVIQTASKDEIRNYNKGLFVSLLDQNHCYFLTENKELTAILVDSIAFTEPAQVPEIIRFLKSSAIFYTLLSSCIRQQTKMGNDMESTMILEVLAVSFNHISVTLQHPYEESLATLEFEIESGNVTCTIFSINNNYEIISNKLSKIVTKCLSIPITVRALLKFWHQENVQKFQCNLIVNGSTGSKNSLNNNGTTNSFSSFGIAIGTNGDSGSASNSNPIGGPSKADYNIRQPMPATIAAGSNMTSNNVPSSFLVYKGGDMVTKEEDFHESPKSQTHVMSTTANASTAAAAAAVMAKSVETCSSSSLGSLQIQQQQQLPDTQKADKATDIEIADKYKNIWKDKTANLKSSLSITPLPSASIPSSSTSMSSETPSSSKTVAPQTTLDVKRTGGIEIIPLLSQPSTAVSNIAGATACTTSSTITITPINTVPSTSAISLKEKKLSQSSTSSSGSSLSSSKRNLDSSGLLSEGQKERKRKKKRDDSPMGPPDKVYSRQNSPASSCDASGVPSVTRKFSSPSSSPKGASGGSMGTNTSFSSTRPSPKHSPVYSSPKHNTASNSPKSPFGTHSPKHGSAGKPSMSTLKSATATGLSPKGDKAGAIGTGSGSISSSSGSSSNLTRSYGSIGENRIIPTPNNASSVASSTHKREKDKSNVLSPASSPSLSPASLPTTSLKGNLNMTGLQQQQQIKPPVSSHLSTGSSISSSNNGSSSIPLEQHNPTGFRKGLAHSTAVGMMAALGSSTTAGGSTTGSVSPAQESSSYGQSPCHQDCTTQDPCNMPSCPLSQLGNSTEYDDYDDFDESPSLDEYMVRRAQEGLKLTLNKTSSKALPTSSANSSSSSVKSKSLTSGTTAVSNAGTSGTGTSSAAASHTSSSSTTASSGGSSSGGSTSHKKHHTGLKPGVHSGPASKKSLHSSSHASSSTSLGSSKGSSSGGSSGAGSGSSSTIGSKVAFQKSSSSGNLSAKLSSSSSTLGNTTSSNSVGLARSSSTNSFASSTSLTSSSGARGKSSSSSAGASSANGGSSLSGSRLDHHTDMLKLLQFVSPSMAEGFMRGIQTKYQIPKLSQRANNAANTTTSSPAAVASSVTTTATGFSTTTVTTSSNSGAAVSAISTGSSSSSSFDNSTPSLVSQAGSQQSQQSTQLQESKSRDQTNTASHPSAPPFQINLTPNTNINPLSGSANSNNSSFSGTSTTASCVSITSAPSHVSLPSTSAISSSTALIPTGISSLKTQPSSSSSPKATTSLLTETADDASQSLSNAANEAGLPSSFSSKDDSEKVNK